MARSPLTPTVLGCGAGTVGAMKRIVVLSDLQIPYHDPKAANAAAALIDHVQPDELACVGDEIDSPQPSRWTKGMAGEYEATLQRDIDATHEMMKFFRRLIPRGTPFHVSRSNHGDRVETYVRRYAPALSSLPILKIDALLGYEELGITYHRQPYELAPGWLLMHGDEGRLALAPGATALGLAKRAGMSVVCGHTHRAGLMHWTEGTARKTRSRWGLEVGHMMDARKASYLSGMAGDWHQAVGVLTVDGTTVVPELVPIVGGRIYYQGKRL